MDVEKASEEEQTLNARLMNQRLQEYLVTDSDCGSGVENDFEMDSEKTLGRFAAKEDVVQVHSLVVRMTMDPNEESMAESVTQPAMIVNSQESS